MRIVRPFKCECCGNWSPLLPCCRMEVEVQAPVGTTIGYFKKEYVQGTMTKALLFVRYEMDCHLNCFNGFPLHFEITVVVSLGDVEKLFQPLLLFYTNDPSTKIFSNQPQYVNESCTTVTLTQTHIHSQPISPCRQTFAYISLLTHTIDFSYLALSAVAALLLSSAYLTLKTRSNSSSRGQCASASRRVSRSTRSSLYVSVPKIVPLQCVKIPNFNPPRCGVNLGKS